MLALSAICRGLKGEWLSHPSDESVTSVAIDSRKVQPGGLFVALKGERFDGHEFIDQAILNGAKAIVVSRADALKEIPTIKVTDTIQALGMVALMHRRNFSGPVIAITGSAGKTSTREVIAKVLSEKYTVLQSARSENNWIGVPLTLLKLKPQDHDVAVVEAGTNQPGDMAWLSRIIRPDIVVFTNIGDSHLAKLKSRTGVYQEKIKLLNFLQKPGCVIYNADDPYLSRLSQSKKTNRLLGYSINNPSDWQGENLRLTDEAGTLFKIHKTNCRISQVGRHHVYNALAALACANELNVPAKNAAQALASVVSDSNRGRLIKQGEVFILDDTYNANPLSFRSTLETMMALPHGKRRIVVAGDMLELGDESHRLHSDLGEYMNQLGVDFLLTVGEAMHQTHLTYCQDNHVGQGFHFDSIAALHRRLGHLVNSGDVVLVKGSRSSRMERSVAYLQRKLKS